MQITAPPGHPATAYAARARTAPDDRNTAYVARLKTAPGDRTTDTHNRVRADTIDKTGCVALRHAGWLYHSGIGRTCAPNPHHAPRPGPAHPRH